MLGAFGVFVAGVITLLCASRAQSTANEYYTDRNCYKRSHLILLVTRELLATNLHGHQFLDSHSFYFSHSKERPVVLLIPDLHPEMLAELGAIFLHSASSA
jgi:hypothetical protein